jgi:Flp pilus assembly protein TadD
MNRPRDAEEHYNHGVFLLNQENHEEALRTLDKALGMDPGNDKAMYAKACACARLGRRDEALEALRQAIESNPSNRVLAASDSDLDSLRQLDGLAELLKRRTSEPAS